MQPFMNQIWLPGYSNFTYLPTTVAPIGAGDGMPVGVQIMGPQYGDRACIQFAELWKTLSPVRTPPDYSVAYGRRAFNWQISVPASPGFP